MADVHETLSIAVGRHQAGQLEDAERIYRQAIELDANNADAWHLLGVVASQRGDHQTAVESIGRAIKLRPDAGVFHSNLGSVHHGMKDHALAAACYRRALELQPDHAETHHSLGNTLKDLGKLEEALACYRRAIELKPDIANAYLGLAGALKQLGRFDEAVACYERLVQLVPDVPEVHNDFGIVQQRLGRLNEAICSYRRALELKPDFPQAHNNLGAALHDRGELPEAIACYRRAVELTSGFAEAHINLGNVLRESGKHDEALSAYQRAIEINPKSIPALCQLIHSRKQLCDWTDLDSLTKRVITAVDEGRGPVPPFVFINLPTTAEQQLHCASQQADRCQESMGHQRKTSGFGFALDPKGKIRLGYLSADFREHAIAWLVTELFERHDREKFEVVGYSYGPDDGSATRRRLVDSFDGFVDIRDDDFATAARRIHEDGIDILLDVSGYMPRARDQIAALRPAPVQVNFLGYPGTLGAEWFDYIVVDDFVVPTGDETFYSESLVYLPDTYLANDTRREMSAATPTREACGLPGAGFVFCAFNQTHKITPEMFDVWTRLLTAVEGSVLWLWENNRYAPSNLRREAESRGIDPTRLVFAPTLPHADHVARYRLADLVLDTTPYNGHTTTVDALWAGCPVVTCAGTSFASRVAGSVLRAVGLPELITHSLEDYEHLTLELARDRQRLDELRQQLSLQREKCALFDGGRYTRNLERALEQMWDRYLSGEPARGFSVADAGSRD